MNGEVTIEPKDRDILLAMLARFLPGVEVWAHGSRVKGHARPASDLDLVAFTVDEQGSQVTALREALDESSLPFRVDLAVWDEIPERFRRNIEEEHSVLIAR